MKISIEDGDNVTQNDTTQIGDDQALTAERKKGIKVMDREKAPLKKKGLPRRKPTSETELKGIIENLTQELKKREEELLRAEDKAVRAQAETENFKKRMSRENIEARKYAAASIIEDLLPSLDNLEKAVSHVQGDTPEVVQLRQGVEMVGKQVADVLKKHGLTKIDVVGKPYDPETSEALQMVETAEYEDGIVLEEFFPGFKFKDRVIRPAKVTVAKNP